MCNLLKASDHGFIVFGGNAPLAQSVERFHGKEKVNGSIPLGGSLDWMVRIRTLVSEMV